MEIKITHIIEDGDIESLLDSAGRGASYWAENELQYGEEVERIMRGGSSRITDIESDPEGKYDLTLEMVHNGLEIMARKSPQDFADILTGDADNNTGDALLQYAIFGDLIYS
jgi:hypothetical protein